MNWRIGQPWRFGAVAPPGEQLAQFSIAALFLAGRMGSCCNANALL
jgi:hypothetical protein